MFAKRDVFALLMSCFAVYYSTLSEGVVSFHPAFVVARDGVPGETAWDRRDPRGGVFASGDVDDPTDSGNARARDDRPPPPRFFDLNGDGVREMLVATGGGASGDAPTLRMVEMEERREEVRSDATSAYGANRNRRNRKHSRSTREILAAEPRRGSAAFFGSADAFQRARVLARVSLLPERPSKSVESNRIESYRPKSDARDTTYSYDDDDDDDDVSGSRTPVAVGVGRVLPARNASSLNERPVTRSNVHKEVVHKGVVVVVTEGWHVVCFDHNLRVMWERALGGDFPKHAKPREAAVLVTAAALFKGDRGTVIVGGRVDLGVIDEEADTRGAFDPLNAELEREEAVRTHAGGESARREKISGGDDRRRADAFDSSPTFARHFNYYAFETGTGELRWKHESDDFHRDVRGLADALTPQHDHKLDAAAREAAEGRHFGEAACREFRESVMASATPHRWTGREDTRLVLARFEHHKRAAKRRSTAEGPVKAETPETTQKTLGESGEDAFFSDSSDFRPNAIVAHQEEGIEVVHLFGGRTLCKMLLTPLDAHADVNGDGVLEHVSARGGGGARLTAAGESFLDEKGEKNEKEKHGDRACWARVSAGTPPRGVVFEGSICRGSMGVSRHARRDGSVADANAGGFISGNTVDVASPVALRRRRDVRVASRGSPSRPTNGRERSVSRLDSIRLDLVFLNSRGEMTSYTHEGTRRWQLRTDSGWARGRGETPGLFAFPLRRNLFGTLEEPLELFYGAETEVALAVGATRATFVTPSGYVLATLTLPARPIAPAVIEDVNGDGLNDVVLRTERGTFAWTQKSRVGARPFAVLAGALCLLVGGVFVAQVAHAHATGTKRLVRSTEMRDGEGRKDR